MESYFTIEGSALAEIVEKKSRFIGHIAHTETEEEALAFIESIRTQHRMARHNVYAYVLRAQGSGGSRVRYTDDGEPAKTAGMPTLETIQHAKLEDVTVIVTRYFGGILLGTGGLVRAYTAATQAAIEVATVVEITRCVDIMVEVGYSIYEQIVRLAHDCGAKIVETDFGAEVLITLRMADGSQRPLLTRLTDLTRGQSEVIITDPFDAAI